MECQDVGICSQEEETCVGSVHGGRQARSFVYLPSRECTVFCTDQAVLGGDLGTALICCCAIFVVWIQPSPFLSPSSFQLSKCQQRLLTCLSGDVHACVIIVLSTKQTCSKHAELLLLNKYGNGQLMNFQLASMIIVSWYSFCCFQYYVNFKGMKKKKVGF